MKKFLTAIVTLGIAIVLTGCGNRKSDRSSGNPSIQAGRDVDVNGEENSLEQVVLTLGTTESSWEITRAVEAYNAKNGKYNVKIVDYSENYPDYDTAQERLKLDLITSKGTDLIWMGDLIADELGFLAGNSEKIGSKNGWTTEEMLELFRKSNKDANAIGGLGIYTAQELVLHSIDDFVDWDSGKANFCNQEFYDILAFCKNEGEWVKATPESVASGTHLVIYSGLSNVSDIQYTNWLLGDHWVAKGWPCKQGSGVKASFYNSFAISSYSNYPEGAWDFLEYYMTLDWLEEYALLHPDIPEKTYQSIHGLPLNKNTFEKLLEWSTVQRLYDTGEPVPLFFGEEEIPDFYANSKEDVEKIREIVALADGRKLSIHSFVSQMIGEEISGYKTGSLSAEQTAEKIQNRIQLYLDEQRR